LLSFAVRCERTVDRNGRASRDRDARFVVRGCIALGHALCNELRDLDR
jgi:hypothetical protein